MFGCIHCFDRRSRRHRALRLHARAPLAAPPVLRALPRAPRLRRRAGALARGTPRPARRVPRSATERSSRRSLLLLAVLLLTHALANRVCGVEHKALWPLAPRARAARALRARRRRLAGAQHVGLAPRVRRLPRGVRAASAGASASASSTWRAAPQPREQQVTEEESESELQHVLRGLRALRRTAARVQHRTRSLAAECALLVRRTSPAAIAHAAYVYR